MPSLTLPPKERSPEPVYATASGSLAAPALPTTPATRSVSRVSARRLLARPELLALIALASVLDLWSLSRNGWANDYYAAAVRSMSTSWHNFLFASLDPSGVMTVDKPPLALWVEALSVRVFGYHPLAMLVPEALMGVATVVLAYDLVRRRFGRIGGFVAGLALATTPITVAISRHNNPDALLVLCTVAALWCVVRALENEHSTRWLVLSGVCVGLGFETKMGAALMIVPGIVAAWMWVAPRGRLVALRQLLAGGLAMVIVGGAWPALVALTPAADRPWVSGTSDNSIFSLILNYNGLGRLDGQTGGPAGATSGGGMGSVFGGGTGPLRLLNSALGGQDGWLLGFALVAGIGLLVVTRLRRSDPRTGWLIAVGGGFLATAVAFSDAKGIFHPYYVSALAPLVAALVGAGTAEILRRGNSARVLGAAAIVAGIATELAVRHDYPGQLSWLPAVLITVGVVSIVVQAVGGRRLRHAAIGVALAALLAAPTIWAFDTLGYATSQTFPSGGPQSVASIGGPGGGGFGGRGGFAGGARGGFPGAVTAAGAGSATAGGTSGAAPTLFGPGGSASSGARAAGGPPSFAGSAGTTGGPPSFPGSGSATGRRPTSAGGPGGTAGFGGGGAGGFGGSDTSLTAAIAYAKSHGGGTIAVSSQSTAASAIVSGNANVAGIGGFSGRESDPTIAWLVAEVSSGHIRWVIADASAAGAGGGGLPGDTRTGADTVMSAVEKVGRKVTLSSGVTLYNVSGDSAALLALN